MALSFIHTYTGRHFYPLQPDPALIDLRDVAHSLSMQARFAGHTRDFYSVAEHSVRVSMACARTDALWGLLHDAAEAYLTDMPKPVKEQLPDYVAAENALLLVVAQAFKLPKIIPASVHRADRLLLNTEARDLFATPPEWADKVNVQSIRIRPLGNRAAESWFLQRYKDLTRVRITVTV